MLTPLFITLLIATIWLLFDKFNKPKNLHLQLELIQGERDQIKSDRVSMLSRIQDLKAENESLALKCKKTHNAILAVISNYEDLSKRYLLTKITNMGLKAPQFDGSSEWLYRIDELRIKKDKGEIDILFYTQQLDQILLELEQHIKS